MRLGPAQVAYEAFASHVFEQEAVQNRLHDVAEVLSRAAAVQVAVNVGDNSRGEQVERHLVVAAAVHQHDGVERENAASFVAGAVLDGSILRVDELRSVHAFAHGHDPLLISLYRYADAAVHHCKQAGLFQCSIEHRCVRESVFLIVAVVRRGAGCRHVFAFLETNAHAGDGEHVVFVETEVRGTAADDGGGIFFHRVERVLGGVGGEQCLEFHYKVVGLHRRNKFLNSSDAKHPFDGIGCAQKVAAPAISRKYL